MNIVYYIFKTTRKRRKTNEKDNFGRIDFLLFSVPAWAVEDFQRKVIVKTNSIDITEKVKGTHRYRAGWVYAIYTIDIPTLKEVVEDVAQDYQQLDPWVADNTGGMHTSYSVDGQQVIVFIQDEVLIITK